MRTREKSKEQLLKELKEATALLEKRDKAIAELLELKQDREAQITLLRKDSDALRKVKAQHEDLLKDRKGLGELWNKHQEVLAERDRLKVDLAASEHDKGCLRSRLDETTKDRDNWKNDYNVVLRNYRRVKKDLFEQARLAGVLATEHDAELLSNQRSA